MNLYYMRDNHTFRSLPLDVEKAVAVLREEFDHLWTFGMLCTKSVPVSPVHAHGGGRWPEFEREARRWLADCINYKSPGDLEYESWAPPHGVNSARAIKPDVAQAMAAEYAQLMAHMDRGGDYFEFMAKRQHSDGAALPDGKKR